ncbi:MAG: hypothetical protein QXI48_06325 [Candidatus Bathyarchaeia archaeon]
MLLGKVGILLIFCPLQMILCRDIGMVTNIIIDEECWLHEAVLFQISLETNTSIKLR